MIEHLPRTLRQRANLPTQPINLLSYLVHVGVNPSPVGR